MKDSEYHQTHPIIAIMKYIPRIQYPQNHLAIFNAPRYRPAELRMFLKYTRGVSDRFGNDRRKMRVSSLKEFFKSIKISEGGCRPFDLHRSCQGLNAGDPQVLSH
jgi:hypothetical protein